MSDIAANIHISGVVQGVGFRYFVYMNSKAFGVKGYVRNLPDGSVEVRAEGPRGLIEDFIGTVRVGPRLSNVTGLSVEWMKCEGIYTTFEIR
jgi:acylphosphatase